MSWPTVPLGDVAEFIRGVTYKPADLTENFAAGSVVCMRTSNVQASLDESDMKSIPQRLVGHEKKMLREGDLLVSTANSWNLVGKCCWVPDLSYKATAGGFIAILRAEESKLDKRYLYHWFSSPNTQVDARNCGRQTTNISNMDVGRCLQLSLPLPPLPEQRRIAAILDKADALRAKRCEAIAKLDQLLQSVFLDMFGDPVTNPKGWPRATFGELIKVKSGDGLTAQNMTPNGRHPVYGGNGISGYHDEFMFKEPQIIIGRVGVYCGVVHRTKPESWVTDNALYVSTMLRPMNQTFLQAILAAANFNQYAGRAAQPLVSGSRIYPVETILPPIDLQDEYDLRVRSLAERSLQMDAHNGLISELFSSLQDWAFASK